MLIPMAIPPVCICAAVPGVPLDPHSHQTLLSVLLIIIIHIGVRQNLEEVLNYVSWKDEDVKHYFKCLLTIHISSLEWW